jgi:hypothetical protein
MSAPYGYCQCGCGQPTKITRTQDPSRGLFKGQPRKYLTGHHRRKAPVDYVVDTLTGCWVWQRGVTALGYGCDKDGMAHRVYYERHKGPIPEGLYIDHLCRNPPCVNPDHLEPVTPAENIRRGRNAKLVAAQVLEIRASKESQASLAIRYGVDPSTISRAVRGDSHAGVKAHEVLHEASA